MSTVIAFSVVILTTLAMLALVVYAIWAGQPVEINHVYYR